MSIGVVVCLLIVSWVSLACLLAVRLGWRANHKRKIVCPPVEARLGVCVVVVCGFVCAVVMACSFVLLDLFYSS